jgi:hypothetical protein
MLKMVNHQFKVLQSVAATLIEGGEVYGNTIPNQPSKPLSFMSLKVHHFAVFVK